jgi:Ig-like domain-containing protein/peptidase M23-like protein/cohesin domain-containing protein/dockerin type I repeat protein
MSNIYKNLLRGISLVVMLVSSLPVNQRAQAAATLPPVDMFQLPWDQGIAWVAIDGFDDGSDRLPGSPHNFHTGGAVDFAPRPVMFKGEDTSNFWVTAAAAGVVSEISKCHLKINHGNGFITEYQHLANIQVHLGDTVARNQRLAIIANASSRQPVCPGSEPPDIPHLHFVLRPTMVGATFAGWQFKYNAFFNSTTFAKDGKIVTLFKPLLNVMSQPTPTPTPTGPTPTGQASATPTLATTGTPGTPGTPPATNTPDPNATATPTPAGQATNTPDPNATATPTATQTPASDGTPTAVPIGAYVTTTVDPTTVTIGETALATVSLNNVTTESFTSAEFTCHFDPALVNTSNITIGNLFGADAVAAMNVPQPGTFILAIAGTQGNKATTSGAVFTFNVTALQAGQASILCDARVSKGDNVLTSLPTGGAFLDILGLTPTPTFTPTPAFTPTIPPTVCDKAEFIAHVTVPPGTTVSPGAAFTKTWRLKNVGTCDWTTSYQFVFFSGAQMGGPSGVNLPASVPAGATVDLSVNLTAPSVPGSYQGYWMFKNASGALFGVGTQGNEPWLVDINVSGPTATPAGPTSTPTPIFTAPPSTPTLTLTPSATPVPGWLTFTNSTFGFQFQYPPQGQIQAGSNDGDTIIRNLPIVQPGTNLAEKYLEVAAGAPATECKSLFPTQDAGVNVTINGIDFLKQTGAEGAAGSLYQWVAYSTLRNGVCVSLNFILHSHNPGQFATPPPVFDYATEAAIFDQIIGTYMWLAVTPTATPTVVAPPATPTGTLPSATPVVTDTPVASPTPVGPTSTPLASPTAASTSIPVSSPTPTPLPAGTLNGQVLADKPVTITVSNLNSTPVISIPANVDGTFNFTVPPGTYRILAEADGYLSAQGTFTVTAGGTTTLPTISLPAGDIDGNSVIDQLDALTIGMNYNSATPAAADLNSDGIINVLDLELLAQNYRKTGAIPWE